MEFIIETAGTYYPKKEDRDKLELLGFTFSPTNNNYEFAICGNITKSITSLDELEQFIKTYGTIIVDLNRITIYDYYLE